MNSWEFVIVFLFRQNKISRDMFINFYHLMATEENLAYNSFNKPLLSKASSRQDGSID